MPLTYAFLGCGPVCGPLENTKQAGKICVSNLNKGFKKEKVDHFCLNWKILPSSKWLQVNELW